MRYQIENGTVSLGGKTILNHIDFSIKGQEKIAVVGRNGAGKTTLLRLISGELSTVFFLFGVFASSALLIMQIPLIKEIRNQDRLTVW